MSAGADRIVGLRPGRWVVLLWCAAAVATLRGRLGLPGLPGGLTVLPAWSWALIAGAFAAALTAGRLLGRHPLASLGLLVAGAVAVSLALGPAGGLDRA